MQQLRRTFSGVTTTADAGLYTTAVDSEASDKAENYTPPKLTTEQANAIEQEKLSQVMPLTVENSVKAIDISGESGIIRVIELNSK